MLWCGGCRRTGVRRLTPEERAWIERLRARNLRLAALGLGIVPAGAAVAFALLVYAPDRSGLWSAIGMTADLYVILLGIPVSILMVRDAVNAYRQFGRDLAGGDAWCFEPPAPAARDAAETGPPAGGAAAGTGPLDPDAGPAAFAVLPHSRRLVDPSGGRREPPRADVIETDSQAANGWYAPLSLEVRGPGPVPEFRQRALSGTERAELARLARSLQWPGPGTVLGAAGLVVVVWAFVAGGRTGGPRPPLLEFLSAALWTALCVHALFRYGLCLRLAARIRRDVAAGVVVHEPGRGGAGTEFLPFSLLRWKEGGAPADWRDRRTAARRLRAGL